jgi:hypothetical protein
MSKHMMVVLVTTFIGVSAGCTSMVNIPIESVKIHQSKIATIEMKLQDTVTFDERGGRYDQRDNMITGATLEGTSVSIRSTDVSLIYLKEDTGFQLAQTKLSMKTYRKSVRDAGRRIAGIVLVSDSVIDFGDNSGALDTTRRIVTGIDKKRHSVVERPYSDISYIRVRKFSLVKTYLATLPFYLLLALDRIGDIPWTTNEFPRRPY